MINKLTYKSMIIHKIPNILEELPYEVSLVDEKKSHHQGKFKTLNDAIQWAISNDMKLHFNGKTILIYVRAS